MIHQYIAQIGLTEQDDHGPIFRQEYLRIVEKSMSIWTSVIEGLTGPAVTYLTRRAELKAQSPSE